MKRFYFNCLRAPLAEQIAQVAGTEWEQRAPLKRTLSPFKPFKMHYYEAPDESFGYRLYESNYPLAVFSIFETPREHAVFREPVKFSAEERLKFKYRPTADELESQAEVLLDFWRNDLGIYLENPVYLDPANLALIPAKTRAEYKNYAIEPDEDGALRIHFVFAETESGNDLRIPIQVFAPGAVELIPEQPNGAQCVLF